MTAPQGPPPFIDPNNPLLAPVATRWDCGTVTAPDGTRVAVVTFRTASTSFHLMLAAADLARLKKDIDSLAAVMGKPGLIVPSATETILIGNGSKRPPAR